MFKFLIVICCLISTFSSYAKEKVKIYTYHDKPPFIIDLKKSKGISFEIISIINNLSSEYDYELVYIPRKRLAYIKEKKIVIWNNEGWVKDAKAYFWTAEILKDADVIIYNKEKFPAFKFSSQSDLQGKDLICVRGYIYPRLTKYFSIDNPIRRVDINSEKQVLAMIMGARHDAGVFSYSTLKFYYKEKKNLSLKVGYSPNPQEVFSRKMLFSKDLVKPYEEVNRILQSKKFKSSFKDIIKSYHFNKKLDI